MELHSPTSAASTSRDPFELERLAEELEARELGHFDSEQPTDLPIYTPLTHTNPFFISTTFNVEEFLLSRSHTSLPDLRAELRDYLAVLKEELVKLINDDYEAFISLSTDLRGEGVRLERLKWPLGTLRSSILESRRELQVIQEAVQTKLKKRSALRDEKTYLHLLLKISESVTRLESLLLIASPDSASSPQLQSLSLSKTLNGSGEDGLDERTRGNRAKHLVRVASEYTQLLYHVAKAQADTQSAFVDEIQWRINRVQSTLSSDLDHLFATAVLSFTDTRSSKLSEVDKTKRMTDLTECLRTYDILGLWRDAEDILKRDFVRDFVKKTIYPGALLASHAPILPRTPLPVRGLPHTPGTASLQSRMPYTPFTAFASSENPFDVALASAPLLDDTDNQLAALYNTILKFVERDLKRIMDIADKITVKAGTKAGAGALVETGMPPPMTMEATHASGEHRGFEILANVVWAEVGRAIMDELGGVVFAAGKPDDFRKNHETTEAFIRSLQHLAPSTHSVEAMVSHPIYLAFERRWQLPVYFQLRWKEIVSHVEEVLTISKVEPSGSNDTKPFVTAPSMAIWAAIMSCWSADVYIPSLSHRFWKLTLQLLSRYQTWLDGALPRLDPASSKSQILEKPSIQSGTPSSLSRASTPNPSTEAGSSETTAADDALLRQFASAITDIYVMESQIWTLWRDEISRMLPEPSSQEGNEPMAAEDALRHSVLSLTSLVPAMSVQILGILTKRACDALLPVRSIPSQFRAMSNKRMPTEPSYFVASILRPIRTFFSIGTSEGSGSALKSAFLKPYSEAIFESVVQRYISYLTNMRKTEESLRRFKKGKKTPFSLFGSSSAKEDDTHARDEERIRTQMILDVNAFGKDAESLGVDVLGNTSFQLLNEMVHASLSEEPASSTPTAQSSVS
ncbi:COG complex component [Artomyces pyxidatus]|uniref:COG complex component n=1 Tax=Artomyces pyxidatus TaxID=48021 RepID=A0ACB8SNM0_9AGAM|nr:COG complex component [Artomyces pyxidatus]